MNTLVSSVACTIDYTCTGCIVISSMCNMCVDVTCRCLYIIDGDVFSGLLSYNIDIHCSCVVRISAMLNRCYVGVHFAL